MRIDFTRMLTSTIIILLIIGVIKLVIFIFKILKTIVTSLFNLPKKVSKFKDNEWNDLDRLVLHTKTRIQVPRSQYQPNQTYYDVFMRNPYNEINIRNITINLLEHAGYEGPVPDIKYIALENEISKHFINRKDEPAYIQITSDSRLHPPDILALIIHECMHIYKSYYKLEYGNGFNQENAADVLAVYLGFYKNLSTAHKFYTSQKELDYIFKRIHS